MGDGFFKKLTPYKSHCRPEIVSVSDSAQQFFCLVILIILSLKHNNQNNKPKHTDDAQSDDDFEFAVSPVEQPF